MPFFGLPVGEGVPRGQTSKPFFEPLLFPVLENPMSETFDFGAWLNGATVAEIPVDIFQDAALLGKYVEWQRRYERASDEVEGERSAGEQSPKAVLEAEGAALLDALRATKSVWFMRALSSDDEIAVGAAHPLPEDPRKKWTELPPTPVKGSTEKQAEAFVAAYVLWSERKAEFEAKQTDSDEYRAHLTALSDVLVSRGAEKIARAFKRIEQGGEVLTDQAPSLEQIKQLPAAIGEMQFGKILDAIDTATNLEPEIPADFLSKGSTTGQD